jgi:UDP-N-acetylglucosamine 2-epimerase (hydrolysing)
MKKIVFITGTRADFGKLKPLMRAVQNFPDFESQIFVTGMHTLSRYGLTVDEIIKAGFRNIHTFINQIYGEPMEMVLANTIHGLSRYVCEYCPDLIVVHGDRLEALAGAIVGTMRNILVAHIEGGELSGTIDDLIRHSATKLSHIHFVANDEAAERLRQMGECFESIYVIGSPDIDIMLSNDLPSLQQVKDYYEIKFAHYAIALLHPVTTEIESLEEESDIFVSALLKSDINYIIIYPNNDEGSDKIFHSYRKLESNPRFRMFPSLRFEYFLTLLKHAQFIIGNSSAGIREAPVYGVPSIDIGTRQRKRFTHDSIIQSKFDESMIIASITKAYSMQRLSPCHYFGYGNSTSGFMAALASTALWNTAKQKHFQDIVKVK